MDEDDGCDDAGWMSIHADLAAGTYRHTAARHNRTSNAAVPSDFEISAADHTSLHDRLMADLHIMTTLDTAFDEGVGTDPDGTAHNKVAFNRSSRRNVEIFVDGVAVLRHGYRTESFGDENCSFCHFSGHGFLAVFGYEDDLRGKEPFEFHSGADSHGLFSRSASIQRTSTVDGQVLLHMDPPKHNGSWPQKDVAFAVQRAKHRLGTALEIVRRVDAFQEFQMVGHGSRAGKDDDSRYRALRASRMLEQFIGFLENSIQRSVLELAFHAGASFNALSKPRLRKVGFEVPLEPFREVADFAGVFSIDLQRRRGRSLSQFTHRREQRKAEPPDGDPE